MRETIRIFKSQAEGAFNADFVVENNSLFAIEVFNNSSENLVILLKCTLNPAAVSYGKYIDPLTDTETTFTVPAGEQHVRTFANAAFPCRYRISSDLGAPTSEAVDSEIWISK